ncbi:MAG: hypothetical protein WBL63_11480, partial [Candidatus Acidiferrum sp.]
FEVLLFGEKDNVAALNVGLRRFKFERLIEGAQSVHFDFVVAADVDSTEHGNDRGHGERQYSAGVETAKIEKRKWEIEIRKAKNEKPK